MANIDNVASDTLTWDFYDTHLTMGTPPVESVRVDITDKDSISEAREEAIEKAEGDYKSYNIKCRGIPTGQSLSR